MNTNNSNKKTRAKQTKSKEKFIRFGCLHLNVSFKKLSVDLQTTLAVKTHLVEAATDVYLTV
jgi:hypothetical protein